MTQLLAEIPPGFGLPSAADWAPLNSNGMCSLTNAPPGPQGCYLAKYFGHNIQRIPISASTTTRATSKSTALRCATTWKPNSRLKFDFGIREDGANYKFGSNLPLSPDPGNPSDVDPSAITAQYLQPRVFEPRLAAAYQMGQNDSLRVGYGRSVNAQRADGRHAREPLQLQLLPNTPGGSIRRASFCRLRQRHEQLAPHAGGHQRQKVGNSNLFYCPSNYAQSLLWLYDQNFDAPDVGAAQNSDYSNYDLTYQHQFHNGWGMRFTWPPYKLGTELPSFALLSQKVDPVTGQILSEVFTVNNLGINRTTGAEFGLDDTGPAHWLERSLR